MMNLNRFLIDGLLNVAQSVTRPLLLVAVSSIAITSHSQEAEYYTWIDENGVTNYAERNPEGINATFVGKSRAFGRPGVPEPATTFAEDDDNNDFPTDESGNVDPDALVDGNAERLAAELAETKRRNCEIGKNNLAQIKAFARIRVSDEKGENRILTDEEKEAKAEQARDVIRENCTG